MVRASLAERIWYETSVPVFLTKYLLPLAATLTVLLVFTNPMNFDWTQRITGGLALLFFAYFVAHTAHKFDSPRPPAEAPALSESPTAVPLREPSVILTSNLGTQMVLLDGRVVISCSFKALDKVFRANTVDQFDRAFVGKWIKLSGEVDDNLGHGEVLLDHIPGGPIVDLQFEKGWEEQLSHLARGSTITIRGKIAQVGIGAIWVSGCELL
jgi:hypothetical protein